MKPATQLILMFAAAGVASYLIAGDWAAEKTAGFPMVAAGGEGLAAAGGAYWAWKSKSQIGAVLGGAAAGLLVSQAKGMLSPPAAPVPSAPSMAPAASGGFVIGPRHPTQQVSAPNPVLSSGTYSGVSAAPSPMLSSPTAPKPELLR